jgi:trans-2,3-dihydro-3-hydroxyanthranilate isomerase
MSEREYYLTDVFAEGPYAGNRLATVTDAADLSTTEMQNIALAFNFAETTFICGGSAESGFDVRIFTPAAEIPFAGHPTLGTAFLLRHVLHRSDEAIVHLNLVAGKIPVTFSDDGIVWMRQNQPIFGKQLDHVYVSEQLGIDESMLDVSVPCQYVSTGLEFLLIPLSSPQALNEISIGINDLAPSVFFFCKGGYSDEQQISARMFAEEFGISEDPATGSANGCLAAYLVEHEYFESAELDIKVGQGYEIQRPSQLYLRAKKVADNHFELNVGGRVNLVASGQWLL